MISSRVLITAAMIVTPILVFIAIFGIVKFLMMSGSSDDFDYTTPAVMVTFFIFFMLINFARLVRDVWAFAGTDKKQ